MAQSSTPSFFSQEELNKLKSDCKTGGLEAVTPVIQKKLKDLDNTEFNIVVTGESGAGKSTFINALRGLQSDYEGAAETGNTLTTMEPTGYKHPNLPNIFLWELPGIRTKQFPADKYMKKMQLKRYDFFIIISRSRFTENDVELTKEIKRMGKNFYLIRSKIDSDLNTFEMEGRKHNTDEELEKIRNYCVCSLKEEGIPSLTVFLISNFKVNEFDFPALNKSLPDILKNSGKGVVILSLPNTTLGIIEKKIKELKEQIWMFAAHSGAVGAVPIPGLSFYFNVQALVTAIIHFHQCLGLDDVSLQKLANWAGKSVNDLKAVVKTPLVGEINEQFVITILMGSISVGIVTAEVVLDTIPNVGSIFGAGSSISVSHKLLTDALNELTENAQRVVQAAFGTD
ncbi:interferon-inducible GTPase 5-like [Cetorhinus maximus]